VVGEDHKVLPFQHDTEVVDGSHDNEQLPVKDAVNSLELCPARLRKKNQSLPSLAVVALLNNVTR
jgi:hypothetical protein